MKIGCAIFDFDGTLFDSMYIWDNVGEIYLKSLGKKPKPHMREDIRPLSLYQSACYFKQEYILPFPIKKIMEDINKIIEHYYIYNVLPKHGVIDFLNRMKATNIPMCIATASERYQIEAALQRCKMNHYFDTIFTCNEIGFGKDKPVIFQRAMEYFGTNRNNTVIFEDALHAIQTAKDDGFIVVAIFDNSEKRQTKIKNLSDCYIKDFDHAEDFWRLTISNKERSTNQ